MTKRAPSLSYRLARSRRTLAAFLLLGGAAMSGLAGPAAAHDHAAPTIDLLQGMAEALPQQPGDAAAPLATWTFDSWLAETYGLRPGAESVAKPSDLGGAPNQQAEAHRSEAVASAAAARGEGDAVGTLFSATGIQSWLPWGTAAKQWVSPLLPTDPQASAADVSAPMIPLANDRLIARALADLTCEEPVDIGDTSSQGTPLDLATDHRDKVAVLASNASEASLPSEPLLAAEPAETSAPSEPPATAPPQYDKLALVGSSPIIATLPDTYLAYDLSPEDLIAMRMYPIDQPSPNYSIARRTSVYGAVAAFESSSWRAISEPAVTVSTAEPAIKNSIAVAPAADPAEPAAPAELSDAEQRLAVLARQIAEAVQPGSDLRNRLQPDHLGSLLGHWSQHSSTIADGLLANLSSPSVESSQPGVSGQVEPIAQAELQAPRQLLESTSPLLPTREGRVLQVELACQAAIDVVMAQAARSAPAEPMPSLAETPSDPVTRALAVATVCDQAAASLEKLAMALRRAGDSWVRQAQLDSGNSSILR